jgi:hypothetical protein
MQKFILYNNEIIFKTSSVSWVIGLLFEGKLIIYKDFIEFKNQDEIQNLIFDWLDNQLLKKDVFIETILNSTRITIIENKKETNLFSYVIFLKRFFNL